MVAIIILVLVVTITFGLVLQYSELTNTYSDSYRRSNRLALLEKSFTLDVLKATEIQLLDSGKIQIKSTQPRTYIFNEDGVFRIEENQPTESFGPSEFEELNTAFIDTLWQGRVSSKVSTWKNSKLVTFLQIQVDEFNQTYTFQFQKEYGTHIKLKHWYVD